MTTRTVLGSWAGPNWDLTVVTAQCEVHVALPPQRLESWHRWCSPT